MSSERTGGPGTKGAPGGEASPHVGSELLRECEAMMMYAFNANRTVPDETIEILAKFNIANLTAPGQKSTNRHDATDLKHIAPEDFVLLCRAHQSLAKLVAPARPATLALLEHYSKTVVFVAFGGPIGVVPRLLLAGMAFLLLFIGISQTTAINPSNLTTDLLSLDGWQLLAVALLYLSAAGLGATFAALFQVNRYITDGTYDPTYEASYWVRIALGLMAGLMLASIINLPIGTADLAFGQDPATGDGSLPPGDLMSKPLLALVGGFSATLVYRVLNRLVDAVQSVFQGDPRDVRQANEESVRSRAEAQGAASRMELAGRVTDLVHAIDTTGKTEDVRQRLLMLQADLLGRSLKTADATPSHTASEPTAPAEPTKSDSEDPPTVQDATARPASTTDAPGPAPPKPGST